VSDGETNTATIIAVQGVGTYAAILCAYSDEGGYTDWYLPAKNELGLLYTNLATNGIGSFGPNYYWSSTEESAQSAWGEVLSTGSVVIILKDTTLAARCVRKTN
jgi:hypothetical protein